MDVHNPIGSAATREVVVGRVLDALALDNELEVLLHARLQRVLGASKFVERLQPEVLGALRAALHWLASRGSASVGESLLGLRRCGDADERSTARRGPALQSRHPQAASGSVAAPRSLLLFCVAVLLPWAWMRLSKLLASQSINAADARSINWMRVVRRLEGIAALASLLVTLRFLYRGGACAPTLPMMVAGVSLAQVSASGPPALAFMEQQLIWRTVADLMLAGRRLWRAGPQLPTPPQAPSSTVQAAVASPRPLERLTRLGQRLGLLTTPPGDVAAPINSTEQTDIGPPSCVFCGASPPHTEHLAPCGHRCCYYCIASARLASSSARCPKCAAALEPLQ